MTQCVKVKYVCSAVLRSHLADSVLHFRSERPFQLISVKTLHSFSLYDASRRNVGKRVSPVVTHRATSRDYSAAR
jgi:hypothetical protein